MGKLFQIDDFSIPPMEELPSLDAVMSEIDSDIGSINSSLLMPDGKVSSTPTPSFEDRQQTGSILRQVIYQGITAQIGSAAVRSASSFCLVTHIHFFRTERKLVSPQQWQFQEWWLLERRTASFSPSTAHKHCDGAA